jgi:membrane protease YdiL (CAAX protease family)
MRTKFGEFLKENRWLAIFEVLIASGFVLLTAIEWLPTPTIPMLAVAWVSLWLRRVGWRGVGLRSPGSWRKTILTGLAGGIGYQALDVLVLAPVLERITGIPIDLSQFDLLQGNLLLTLFALGFSWSLAAFGEEMVFRGYLVHRLADIFPNQDNRWMIALVLSAVLFSIGHLYQGFTGVIDTFLAGIFLGALYVYNGRNLWLPILTHGVINTAGFLLLYWGVAF